jgi:acetolactate synthase-1/2/3 large subunit
MNQQKRRETVNGADLIVKILQEHGVEFISTLCGNGLEPLYSACVRAGMRVVDTRNEQAAAYMADAYARLSGRLGVCAVSSGIAHINALAGVANAWFDGAPMLLITGESPTPPAGRGKFQEMEQTGLAAPVCKVAKRVDKAELLGFELCEMLAQALAGRPGPVHLTVPADVMRTEVSSPSFRPPSFSAGSLATAGDPALIAQSSEWIAAAERPLLVLGSGAFYAGAKKAARAFMSATDIPTVVPIWDRGVVERGSPQWLGVIGAASGGPQLLADTDLLIVVGARTDYRIGYARPPQVSESARVIRVDADAAELATGTPGDISILGDPASVLSAWTQAWQAGKASPHAAWLAEARRRDAAFRACWRAQPPAGAEMTGHHVVEALRPFLTEETVLLIDGGNIGQWAHQRLADGYPEQWLTCGASGVVGWGLGGAMGARLAYPDRPIVLLSGDGAIGFTLTEFESATRQGLPFVVVLADDQAWGIVVCSQRTRGPEEVVASCMMPVRYDQVAEGLGAVGIRADRPEDIAPAIQRALDAGCPALVHVPIVPQGPSDEPA